MSQSVIARSLESAYQVEVRTPSGNQIIADEPISQGGGNTGFSPNELLAAALATCTNVTLSMYASRKTWDTGEISVKVSVIQKAPDQTEFHRLISFSKELSADQKDRLLAIANKCPVHRLLEGKIQVKSKWGPVSP